jgi:hypothetical protein
MVESLSDVKINKKSSSPLELTDFQTKFPMWVNLECLEMENDGIFNEQFENVTAIS